MNTFALAWRNLLRNRRRSVTTLLAMIVGANAVLLFGGYSRNITYGLQTDYVKYGGHLQIQREGYYRYGSGNPAAYGLSRYREIIAAIQQDPALKPLVRVATPTLQLQGIAGNFSAGVSRTALGLGVVVEDQNRMRAWNGYDFPVQVPRMALTGTGPETAVLGTGLARVLQLCSPLKLQDCQPVTPTSADRSTATPAEAAGPIQARPSADPSAQSPAELPPDIAELGTLASGNEPAPTRSAAAIEMLAATAQGAPNVARLQVVKAEEQGVKEFDDVYVGLHLAQAQRLVFGGQAPKATAIVLQLERTDQIPAARARLEQLLAERFPQEPVEVLDFSTLNPFYGQALAMFATLFGFVALLIAAIVLFTVGNTMSMAVIERTVEIGTLRAMGLRRARLRRLFMHEGLLLGVVGAALGVGIAAGVAGLINHSGLTWTPPGRSPVPLIIRVWGETDLIVGTTTGLILVAALSAWLPSLRASRQNIVEALRHV